MAYKPKPNDKEKTKAFINKIFLKCGYCGYNNERKRLQHFKGCLKCHRPLGDENYFKNKLLDKIKEVQKSE